MLDLIFSDSEGSEKFWAAMEWIYKTVRSTISTLKEFVDLMDWTKKKSIVAAIVLAFSALMVIAYGSTALWLMALAPIAFIQNMFFTLVSRSRNSKDTDYHRYCAWGSNGVWFICQVMIVKNVWAAIHAGNWWYAGLAGLIYSLATTEGSVLMMKKLIRSESGKRRVGANDKIDGMDNRIQVLEKMVQLGGEFSYVEPSKSGE
jgi:sulfite exporter TauE/SafE